LLVTCVRDYTLADYCDAIARATRGHTSVRGTAVLLDIRLSEAAVAHEEYVKRCHCFATRAHHGSPLKVAVLTITARIPCALRCLSEMADHGLRACAFTDFDTAIAWLRAASA
jgi:hypothetical protein